jgi:hypothetical protein
MLKQQRLQSVIPARRIWQKRGVAVLAFNNRAKTGIDRAIPV